MTDNVEQFERDLQHLLVGLTDADKLKRIQQAVGEYLKKATRDRIKAQEDIHGASFTPRKPIQSRTAFQRHSQRKRLLSNITRATFLRSKYRADRLEIGYNGRTAQLARWHNEGSVQRMKAGYHIIVPQREYMGIADADWTEIQSIVTAHF